MAYTPRHQLNPFPGPVDGQDLPTVIFTIRGQDNTIAAMYNAHDADGTIHLSGGATVGTLTFGTHLTGGSFNGSANVTIATDATSSNTVSTIVARDGSGNFSANIFSATNASASLIQLLTTGVGSAALSYTTNSTLRWTAYVPSGSTDMRWANASGTDRLTLSQTGVLTNLGLETDFLGTGQRLRIEGDGSTAPLSAASGPGLEIWGNNSGGINGAYLLSFNRTAGARAGMTFDGSAFAFINGTVAATLSTAAQPNVTSVGTLTGLNVSGGMSTTGSLSFGGGAATLYNVISVTGTTTAAAYQRMSNTGADCIFGIERSTGGVLLTGSAAYAGVITMVGNTPLQFGSNNTLALSMLGNAVTMPGTLAVTGLATFNASAGAWLVSAAFGRTSTVSTTGTNAAYHSLSNTGGDSFFGMESSVAGGIFTGAAAYATVVYSTLNDINILPGSGKTKIGGTALTVSGTISAAGLPTSAGASGTLWVDGSGFVKRA